MSTALLPVTLSMLCAGMAGIFLVLGVLVLGVYALNKFFSGKKKSQNIPLGLCYSLKQPFYETK